MGALRHERYCACISGLNKFHSLVVVLRPMAFPLVYDVLLWEFFGPNFEDWGGFDGHIVVGRGRVVLLPLLL